MTVRLLPDATDADGAGGGCYTLNTIDRHAVVYALDSHPMDSRIIVGKSDEPTATLTSKQRKGGADGILLLIESSEVPDSLPDKVQRHTA